MSDDHAKRLLSILPPDHFSYVKDLMEVAIGRLPSDDEAREFLARHVDLLGMIVRYDEVETEARSLVWQHCRTDYPAVTTR